MTNVVKTAAVEVFFSKLTSILYSDTMHFVECYCKLNLSTFGPPLLPNEGRGFQQIHLSHFFLLQHIFVAYNAISNKTPLEGHRAPAPLIKWTHQGHGVTRILQQVT